MVPVNSVAELGIALGRTWQLLTMPEHVVFLATVKVGLHQNIHAFQIDADKRLLKARNDTWLLTLWKRIIHLDLMGLHQCHGLSLDRRQGRGIVCLSRAASGQGLKPPNWQK